MRAQLSPLLPEAVSVKGTLIFRVPVVHILAGVDAATSGFDAEQVYLEAFAMPLFTPQTDLTYWCCRRLGGPSHSETVAGDALPHSTVRLILEEGIPFVQTAGTLEGFVSELRGKALDHASDVEVAAYARLLLGDTQGARELIARALKLTPRYPDDEAAVQRCRHIGQLLDTHLEAAAEQLTAWERESLANLGLSAVAGG